MLTFTKQDFEKIAEYITDNSYPNNFSVYLTGLLFAIVLNINWLIITFSVLLACCILKYINKKFKIIEIKRAKNY